MRECKQRIKFIVWGSTLKVSKSIFFLLKLSARRSSFMIDFILSLDLRLASQWDYKNITIPFEKRASLAQSHNDTRYLELTSSTIQKTSSRDRFEWKTKNNSNDQEGRVWLREIVSESIEIYRLQVKAWLKDLNIEPISSRRLSYVFFFFLGGLLLRLRGWLAIQSTQCARYTFDSLRLWTTREKKKSFNSLLSSKFRQASDDIKNLFAVLLPRRRYSCDRQSNLSSHSQPI